MSGGVWRGRDSKVVLSRRRVCGGYRRCRLLYSVFVYEFIKLDYVVCIMRLDI